MKKGRVKNLKKYDAKVTKSCNEGKQEMQPTKRSKCHEQTLKQHLWQKWILLLGRELLKVSSTKWRYTKKITLTLLLYLLKSLQELLPLVRCNFSSSTELALKAQETY